MFCYITKMLQKYSIQFCNSSAVSGHDFQNTPCLAVPYFYCFESICNITIEYYLVPDQQKIINICSLTYTMPISTTARQTSNCMQIITYHVARFQTNHFQNTPCPAVSNFRDFKWIQIEKTELSCAIFQIIVLLYCFALVQLFYNL